jgi:hypothetical protein
MISNNIKNLNKEIEKFIYKKKQIDGEKIERTKKYLIKIGEI